MSPLESSIAHLGDRFVRRDAGWRIPSGCREGALAGVRIGAILHPAVLLALADGAGFLSTEIAHPRSVRISEMLGRSAHLRNRRGEQNAGSGSDQLFTGRH